MMKSQYERAVIEDATFPQVAAAMCSGHANIYSDIADDVAEFESRLGLKDVPCVCMATHSIGGREWELEEGATPAFFEEKIFNGGWYFLREEEVRYLRCVSATSGSSVEARKNPDGTWRITLEVPIRDGVPYRGAYATVFYETFTDEESPS